MNIVINTDILGQLSQDGDKILLSQEGEESLIQLYKIQEMVEQAIHDAKEKIKTAALAVDPNFMSIQGDKVKISYRAYGPRFSVDQTMIEQMDPSLYKSSIRYTAETKAVEAFVDEHKGLPVGIKENEREKQIQVSIKEAK